MKVQDENSTARRIATAPGHYHTMYGDDARFAVVAAPRRHGDGRDIEALRKYLPSNYEVAESFPGTYRGRERQIVIIGGVDKAGWTLDDYVIPRLQSGLYTVEEIHDDRERPRAGTRGYAYEDEDDPPMDVPACPACGSSEPVRLGALGQLDWYSCRACGIDWSARRYFTAEHSTQGEHVRRLARDLDVRILWHGDVRNDAAEPPPQLHQAWADCVNRSIHVADPDSFDDPDTAERAYWIALHELGHIACGHMPVSTQEILEGAPSAIIPEIEAWDWALSSANREPSRVCAKVIAFGLHSYLKFCR